MWPWLLALGVGAVLMTVTTEDRRSRLRRAVVAAARSQLERTDPAPYWLDVLGPAPWPPSWCGAFALWAIHQAGLGTAIKWDVGYPYGFCHHLRPVKVPQPGDVAYFTANQHHAIVAEVDVARGTMTTIDGNSDGAAVVEHRNVPLSKAAGFFSIDPWLEAA